MTKQHLSRRPVTTLCLTILTILSCSRFASAQNAPPFNGIAHVAIRVHDLAASVAFYQKLGFEQAFDLRKDDVPYESFIKINDSQFIELYPITEKNPDLGFLHLCFEGVDLNAIYDDYAATASPPRPSAKPAPATSSSPSPAPSTLRPAKHRVHPVPARLPPLE